MAKSNAVFSKSISAGTRVYYLDVEVDGKGQPFVAISEIPTDIAPKNKRRQRIFIHSENLEDFAKAFSEAVLYIAKNDIER